MLKKGGRGMIEVTIDSVRISLKSHNRVVFLREVESGRYLPIWIGPFEAEAIAIAIEGIKVARPLTHDLLKAVIDEAGATVSRVVVNELRDNTFYARIIMDVNGRHAEVDSRPSDAIALAVRVGAPVFVADSVMEQAGIVPETEEAVSEEEEEKLSVFRDFIDTLDL